MSEKKTILIIDDEPLVREAVSMVLDRVGYVTTPVSSAIEALKLLQDHIYSLIITDIVMPEMDGVAFIKELRRNNNPTPVITISGGARVGQKNMLKQSLEAGACQALRKPVNKQQIVDAIEAALT